MIHFYAFTSNRPDFIELQVKSFKKYLQEEFSFTVFNNSKFDRMPEYLGIEDMCRKYEIMTFDVLKDDDLIAKCNALETSCRVFNNQGSYSNPNCAGCYACCYVWEKHISKQLGGNICLLHPDVFLDHPVRLSDYLQSTPLCFMPQTRPNLGGIHMHDAMVLADMSRLPDPDTVFWWGSRVNNILTDIGGQTYHYLKAHPNLNPILIQQRFTEDDPTLEFHPSEFEVFSIADKPIALHYLRGSNWNYRSLEYHQKKTAWLKEKLNLEQNGA